MTFKRFPCACWSHARRKISAIHVSTTSPAAKRALELIGYLFALETTIRSSLPAERQRARAGRSAQSWMS